MIRLFTSPTQRMGQKGEREAVRFLKKQGFHIVERNIANKFGEIDIVAKKKGIHHFFEVKTARAGSIITPADNLTSKKLQKFLRSVEYYCLVKKITEYRISAVLILLDADSRIVSIEQLEL